jgi:hypothetical protein
VLFAIEKHAAYINRTSSLSPYDIQPFAFIKFKELQDSLSESDSHFFTFRKKFAWNSTKETLLRMDLVVQAFKDCGLRLQKLFRKITS